MEFFRTALELRFKITNLLLRDFGIKDKIRNLAAASGMTSRGMTKEDYDTLDAIYRKYNIGRPLIERYPSWMIDHFRLNILEILKNLIQNIVAANTIYPVNIDELNERRKYQTHAIVNCEQLLQEMQYVIYILPCDINKYMPYVELITKEIKLLKGWRKGYLKLLVNLLGKEDPDLEEAGKKKKKPSKTDANKDVVESGGESEKKNDEGPQLELPPEDDTLLGERDIEALVSLVKEEQKRKNNRAAERRALNKIRKQNEKGKKENKEQQEKNL